MGNIEVQGVASLDWFIASSSVLEPFLDKNDRTPSWDGNIFVYKTKSVKSDFFGKVPVQIKCERVKIFNGNSRSFQFNLIDLENYYRDGGILVFVVEINSENENQIYYASLVPSDLQDIIENIKKSNNKSKAIKLKKLEKTSTIVLEGVCKNFIINKNKQISIKDYPRLPIADAQTLMISGVTDGTPVERYLLNEEQYLYGKRNKDEMKYFVKKINFDAIGIDVKKEVRIQSIIYFNNYEVVSKKNSTVIKIGKNISFDLNTLKLVSNFSGTLAEQLLDNKFLVDIYEAKYFYIDNQKIEIKTPDEDTIIFERLLERYSRLKDVEALLNIFSIENHKLNLDEVKGADDGSLKVLIDFMVYGKKVTKIPFTGGIKAVKIGNLVLGVVIFKKEDDTYTIENLFGSFGLARFFIGKDTPDILASPYVTLQYNILLQLDNLSFDIIVKSIRNVKYTKDFAEHVNFFLLEVIKAYDKSEQIEYFKMANEIVAWLLDKDKSNPIFNVNKYQLIKRERNYSQREKKELLSMRDNANIALLCGISILLENKTDVEHYFNKLSIDEKKEFIEYPIYKLGEKLNLV